MDYMKTLPDKTFDICITSPPYNMNTRVNAKGVGYCSRQMDKGISTKYKNYSDNLSMLDYEKFLTSTIRELVRVSGTVFFNIQQVTGNKPALYRAIGELSEYVKEVIIWDKCCSQPAIGEQTLNSLFEYIFVFGGNPITRQFRGKANFSRGSEDNVFRIRPANTSTTDHKAGFPIKLPNKILKLFASAGSRVFDPFLGTGTTAIAAHYFGCDFVGCEIDKYYYDAAVKRFNDETKQLGMAI